MPEPTNLHYVDSCDYQVISAKIQQVADKAKGAHFTNGTYAYKAEMIVPTTLAGFKRVSQNQPHLPFVIAVNSDESMKALSFQEFEPQKQRADKVAIPLAQCFPETQVIVIYYNQKTPFELYQALKENNLTRTLHKWGYGTKPDAPKIEGAELFEITFGFPLPNDQQPVCFNQTDKQDPNNPQKITVVDLRDDLVNQSGVLFDLPESLKQYQGQKEKAAAVPSL